MLGQFKQNFEKAEERASRQSKPNGKAGPEPFPYVLAKDISLEPKDWLIEGFLARLEQSAWYGPPDAGKSTVVTHAACCVAAGISFCGRDVAQGPVIYAAAERGAVVKRRVKAWCLDHAIDDIPLAIIDQAIDLRSSTVDAERVIATANTLQATFGQPVNWILFDTLNRVLAGGDENSPKDMGALIRSVDHVFRATKAHSSLVHHVPQDRSDRMRGHGLVLGALDITVRVTKESDGTVIAEVDKGNDLVDRPRFGFSFKSVTVYEAPETTAPVLVELDAAPAKARSTNRKLSDRQRLALNALAECPAEPAPATLKLPTGILVVPADTWRDELFARGVLDRDAASPREDFRRVRNSLQVRGLIGVHSELVWRAQ